MLIQSESTTIVIIIKMRVVIMATWAKIKVNISYNFYNWYRMFIFLSKISLPVMHMTCTLKSLEA